MKEAGDNLFGDQPSTGKSFKPSMVEKCGNVNLLIATFSLSTYSETFIRQHINLLPFNVRTLSGEGLSRVDDSQDLFQGTTLPHLVRTAINRLTGRFGDDYRDRRIAKFLKREGITVVLAEYGTVAVRVLRACKRAGVPLISHFHGYDAHNRDVIEPIEHLYKELFAYSDTVVGVSKDMCSTLEQLGAAREKIEYVPYFVNPEHFGCVDVGANPPVFISVGRFVEKKAPDLTLLAFAKVLQSEANARLHMVGQGELLGPAKRMAAALSLGNSVTFHGALSHERVSDMMKNARCFVLHSVQAENGDCEGTPVSILEAQVSGVPVVSTRHAGIKDVVVHGETGFLVEEGDVQGMANHMLAIGRNSELASKLGQNARRKITSRFGAEQTISKLAGIIARSSSRATA